MTRASWYFDTHHSILLIQANDDALLPERFVINDILDFRQTLHTLISTTHVTFEESSPNSSMRIALVQTCVRMFGDRNFKTNVTGQAVGPLVRDG